jgi:hypothetical protein
LHNIKVDTGGMAIEVEPFHQSFLSYVVMRQRAAKEQPGKMASDMGMHMKQR